MIPHRPIRSAGVLALLVAAAVGFSVDGSDARPSKRAPQRTAKQVKSPPARAPLPRPNPVRETVLVEVDVPLPRPNPLNAVAEIAAPSAEWRRRRRACSRCRPSSPRASSPSPP
jgi:hypothetical protein